MTEIQPWEKQDGEHESAWEAFQKYRDLGKDRTHRKVADQLNCDHANIGRFSSRYGWVRRVAAYDRHIDAQRRHDREEANRQMERRQARQLEAAAQALTAPVQELLRRLAEARGTGTNPYAGLPIQELQRLATQSIRHLAPVIETERLVAGLSTENINPDAPASLDEARRRAEKMDRRELEDYLLGFDDGKRDQLRELGLLEPDPAEPPPA